MKKNKFVKLLILTTMMFAYFLEHLAAKPNNFDIIYEL